MFGDMGNTFSTIRAYRYTERRLVMPWQETTNMSLRMEFIQLAQLEGANICEFCRPHRSPRRSSAEVESAIVEVRRKHPAWGVCVGCVLISFSPAGLDATFAVRLRRNKKPALTNT
jgi:hypothetical protein